MNSTILKNGVTIFNIFMASTFIFWTIGCQSDDELESVNNSSVVACTSELEDFIIAATDLQQSLIVFEKELLKKMIFLLCLAVVFLSVYILIFAFSLLI